ncbi:MAG: hypothetical protein WCS67_05945 [Bacteroidales bacterium]
MIVGYSSQVVIAIFLGETLLEFATIDIYDCEMIIATLSAIEDVRKIQISVFHAFCVDLC